MLTAMLTADNIVKGYPAHDVWAVNVEQDYHEEQASAASAGAGQPSQASNERVGTGRDAPVIRRAARLAVPVRSLER